MKPNAFLLKKYTTFFRGKNVIQFLCMGNFCKAHRIQLSKRQKFAQSGHPVFDSAVGLIIDNGSRPVVALFVLSSPLTILLESFSIDHVISKETVMRMQRFGCSGDKTGTWRVLV
jgi:hypothetical protein